MSRLGSDLLDADDDELCRFQGSEPDGDVHDPPVDVLLRVRVAVALDEVGLSWGDSLEGVLAEQAVHEGTHIQPDLRPQGLVVGLEDHPLGTSVQALLDVQGGTAHR